MLFSREVHVSLFSFQQIGSACSHRCSYLVKSHLSLVFRTCGFLCLEYPFPSIPALAVSPLILQLSVHTPPSQNTSPLSQDCKPHKGRAHVCRFIVVFLRTSHRVWLIVGALQIDDEMSKCLSESSPFRSKVP